MRSTRGTLTLQTAPATEPVTLGEAKIHLRIDSDNAAEDAYLTTLLLAAREMVEAHTRRALITQTWDWVLDAFPCARVFELPKAPLVSVSSITYVDTAGDTQTWATSNYTVRAYAGPRAMPGTVALKYGISYPVPRSLPDVVTIRFVAGYGAAAAVPAPFKQAILLLAAEMYARREEAIIGTIKTDVSVGVSRILSSYVVPGW